MDLPVAVRQESVALLPSFGADMAADDSEYREFCRRLEALGVDRKAMAMGMGHEDQTWITRWMNQTRKRKINADEIKKFGQYLDKLTALLETRPDRAKPAPAARVDRKPA